MYTSFSPLQGTCNWITGSGCSNTCRNNLPTWMNSYPWTDLVWVLLCLNGRRSWCFPLTQCPPLFLNMENTRQHHHMPCLLIKPHGITQHQQYWSLHTLCAAHFHYATEICLFRTLFHLWKFFLCIMGQLVIHIPKNPLDNFLCAIVLLLQVHHLTIIIVLLPVYLNGMADIAYHLW